MGFTGFGPFGLLRVPSLTVIDDLTVGDDATITGDLTVAGDEIGALPAIKTGSGAVDATTTIWNGSSLTATLPLNPGRATRRTLINIHTTALTVAADTGDTLAANLEGGYVLPGRSSTFHFLSSSRTWYRVGSGSVSYLPFWLANVGANLTNSETMIVDNANSTQTWVRFPRPVLLTGISFRMVGAGAGNTGTITFTPITGGHVGSAGTDPGASYDVGPFTPDGTGELGGSGLFTTPLLVAADTTITVGITTSGTWNATAGDIHVMLGMIA